MHLRWLTVYIEIFLLVYEYIHIWKTQIFKQTVESYVIKSQWIKNNLNKKCTVVCYCEKALMIVNWKSTCIEQPFELFSMTIYTVDVIEVSLFSSPSFTLPNMYGYFLFDVTSATDNVRYQYDWLCYELIHFDWLLKGNCFMNTNGVLAGSHMFLHVNYTYTSVYTTRKKLHIRYQK